MLIPIKVFKLGMTGLLIEQFTFIDTELVIGVEIVFPTICTCMVFDLVVGESMCVASAVIVLPAIRSVGSLAGVEPSVVEYAIEQLCPFAPSGVNGAAGTVTLMSLDLP